MDLDRLYRHEAGYYGFSSELYRTEEAWFLTCPDLPQSRDTNRAMRLRDTGAGPQETAAMAVGFLRGKGVRPTIEIDSISEQQGIGRAVRQLGITPVLDSRSLLTYPGKSTVQHTAGANNGITVERVEGDPAGTQAWLDTALHDVEEYDRADMWRELARREAYQPGMKLYLGTLYGELAGTCSVYYADGMARIEMVETRTAYRRRGVASEILMRAVSDCINDDGVEIIYLYTDTGSDAERLYFKIGFALEAVDVLRRHILS